MALLHGSWIHPSFGLCESQAMPAVPEPDSQSFFFLWGETWRSSTTAVDPFSPASLHPFSLSADELSSYLLTLHRSKILVLPPALETLLQEKGQKQPASVATERWQDCALGLLCRRTDAGWLPLHSAAAIEPTEEVCLYPFRVGGLCLSAAIATEFLLAIPLGSDLQVEDPLGPDLRYWSHVSRWSLDLLVRSKVLPAVRQASDRSMAAYWEPLLDSALDRTRLRQMKTQMPLVCQCYTASAAADRPPALDLPPSAEAILLASLQQMVDRQVRRILSSEGSAATLAKLQDKSLSGWLSALERPTGQLNLSEENGNRLLAAFAAWIQPLQLARTQQQFRAAFALAPPLPSSQNWSVSYGLQAADDPNCWVSAEQIWATTASSLSIQGRTLEHPQETLLAGLGLASRVYPAIEDSLQTARPTQHALTPLQAYDFLKSATWRLEDSGFGVVVPPKLANREGWANRLGLQVRAAAPAAGKAAAISLTSLLNFKWELTIGGQRLSKSEFDHLVSLNSPLVEVNGEWVELRPQDIRSAEAFFASRQGQAGLTLEDALKLNTGDVLTLDKLPVVKFEATGALEQLLNTLSGNQTVQPIEQPQRFEGTLRPYQALGAGWLSFLEQWNLGACLADDMGLGKTVQLIAFLLHLKAEKRWSGPMLLICPTSVLGNWEREIKRFAPTLKTLMHHGTGRLQGKSFAQSAARHDVVLTSYALIPRDEKALVAIDWQGIILDEAQNIKNPEARQSQSVRKLQAKNRIALTGTPLENRLTELWSILDFLNPGYLGSKAFFQKRFAVPIEKYGDTASLQTLRSLAQPFILRRTKTDRTIIQDLPEKQEMTVFCPLTPEQAALYEKTVQESLEAVESAEGIQRHGVILATLTKLKQICNHPAQYLKEAALKQIPQRSGKLKRLEEMLEEALAEGDRALIFTQFAEMGKLLQAYLQQVLNRETLLLYGGVTKPKREAMIDRFQNDPQGPRLFILSLKAGGVGLNLTRANHVFHFDRWWNPAVENQATDRVFRIGQTRNVQVHKFVCSGTLEERIHDTIESKKALADQVVGAGENWLSELGTDQLRQLLLLDRNTVIEEEV
ncbi:DEAD/DEAH box helicase [Altericista sp. CCNU0014]|uniref:DEAD/DEAH box helicase n=1 Tax=Altericista sp. CCNU0014 TaxID=3082949 RepID=UPI00384D732D